MKPIISSNLVSAEYEDGKVRVKFKSGGTYEYEGIDQKTWDEFEKTFESKESSGKYFVKHIKKDKFKKING